MDNPDRLAVHTRHRTRTNKTMDNPDRLAVHTRHRTKTNKTMDNPDKLPTQVTGRRPTTQWTIQINWKHKTHVEDKQNNGQSR
jgi:hypothetical protein